MVSSFKRKLTETWEAIKLQRFWNGIKLLTRLHVKFSDLREDKFRHNFYVTLMCMCSEDTETTEHYLLRYQLYADRRGILFDTVSSIIKNDVSTFQENDLCSLLLYGDLRFNEILNRLILESTITFIHDSGRFIRYVWLSMRKRTCHVITISFKFDMLGRAFTWNLFIMCPFQT